MTEVRFRVEHFDRVERQVHCFIRIKASRFCRVVLSQEHDRLAFVMADLFLFRDCRSNGHVTMPLVGAYFNVTSSTVCDWLVGFGTSHTKKVEHLGIAPPGTPTARYIRMTISIQIYIALVYELVLLVGYELAFRIDNFL